MMGFFACVKLLRHRPTWCALSSRRELRKPFAASHRSLLRALSTYPDHEVVGLPALSPTMQTGTITKWCKKEGESIAAGDIICEVETDKAVVEFESQDDYYLAKILKPEGSSDIRVGEPIFISTLDQSSVAAFETYQAEDQSSQSASFHQIEPDTSAKPSTPSTPTRNEREEKPSDRIFASPLAKKLARESNISLEGVTGSGPQARILKVDVEEAIQNASTQSKSDTTEKPSPAASSTREEVAYSDYPLNPLAIEFADSLTRQKTSVPHFHLAVNLTLDKLLNARDRLNAGRPQDRQLSVYDFIIRAASLAMKTVPEVNSAWKESFIRQFHNVNINLVLSSTTKHGGGTIAPMLANVHQKGLDEINQDVSLLVENASGTSLSSQQLGRGTFTICNVGMYEVRSMAGIICPEQACLLGLGTIEKKVVPNEDPDAKEIYKFATQMTATLACDHRVVDGAVGAQWLAVFKELVEDPLKMIL
uniref:Dihydrolipoamide acetyltransferase component of pyruvate dehydrogenase complex n=1 Tax=Albugo laibachii Nc14 TaxID=890382 RepID=F0WHI3_9STRA|nr:unnamed protein product [Albugo laibachii Nc14]|eukprot:CCA20702.1 unnamed protein product [Albugo laibachii Nc14]